MALTLEAEQSLERGGLIALFSDHDAHWREMAAQSYRFLVGNFPNGATVRPDDVAKTLTPLLEVDDLLTNHLAARKLKQKYWKRYFCDLVLDRCWARITVRAQPAR
jgi:hypothetical protein